MKRLSCRIAGLLCTIAVAGALEQQIQTQRAAAAARMAVEQASIFGWERYAGCSGRVIGMTAFGAPAPLNELQRKFGFEPGHLVDVARELLRGKASE